MKSNVAAAFSAVVLLSTAPTALTNDKPPKQEFPTSADLVGRTPTSEIRVYVQLYRVPEVKRVSTVRQWGRGLPNDTLIRSLHISIDGADVRIPRRAYVHLRNICLSCFTCYETPGKVYLSIEGGDAGAGYETRIEIAGGIVTQRETVGGNFRHPHRPFERVVFRPDGTIGYSLGNKIPPKLNKPGMFKIPLYDGNQ